MPLQCVDDLSEAELQRTERLVEAATVGPWISYIVGRDADADLCVANYIELGTCNELGSLRSIELVGGSAADQDFIASARQDVPKLLLEVRALRACLDSLRAQGSRPQLQNAGGIAGPSMPASHSASM
jgi:hypothetical protein